MPARVAVAVYLLGNWPPPFAIVLVLDRLSAMMLALTAALALPALIFSLARWHKAGPHFHTLFLFLLVGLNGAFLTGDLFNLFVFFEVMLAASYGLVLHGSGPFRVGAGMHYIAMNLAASLLFLIGVSPIYGVTGTLNMADLAQHIPNVPDREPDDAGGRRRRPGYRLPREGGHVAAEFLAAERLYGSGRPGCGHFAILSKVGIYVLLRLSLLFFGERAGPSVGFGWAVLLFGGMATIAFGAIGVLASKRLGPLAASRAGVLGNAARLDQRFADAASRRGALFYMVSSTLTMGAFFLLIELVERGQDPTANVPAVTVEAYGEGNESDEEDEEVGVAFPGTIAALGISFAACGILLAGLPPLSGFVAKFAILSAMLQSRRARAGRDDPRRIVVACDALILSGLSALIAMSRAGIRPSGRRSNRCPRVCSSLRWRRSPPARSDPAITLEAGPTMRFMEATEPVLHSPSGLCGWRDGGAARRT